MTIHTYTQGEDLAAIRARLELDDEAILHIGAAGAIHFDDAAEQDAYDDRILDEAKGIRKKRGAFDKVIAANEARRGEKKPGAGRPKGAPNKKTLAMLAEKGGSN